MYDELVDIVNEQDQVDRGHQPGQLGQQNLNTRIVLAFIVNHEKKFAILRRTADKIYSPLHLSIVGGGVQSGETYEQAAKREIAEEVNIQVDQHQFKFLGLHQPHEGWHNPSGGLFKAIYEVTMNSSEMNYSQADFCELLWLTPEEILKKTESDKVATGLVWLLERYYL